MSLRISFFLILVVSGVLSPWLVRDLLDQRQERVEREERQAAGAPAALAALSDEVRSSAALRESLRSFVRRLPSRERGGASLAAPLAAAEVSGPAAGGGGLALEIEPFPLAASEGRVFKGLFKHELSPSARSGFSIFGGDRLPETARSREAAAAVSERIAPALEESGLRLGAPVFLRLFKEERELEVWVEAGQGGGFALFRRYEFAGLSGRPGPKRRDGDGQVPEGFYVLGAGSLRPDTRHFLGLDLGYPNAYDRYHNHTGGDILIHGGEDAWGAVALGEDAIGEVYTLVHAALSEGQSGVPVNVFPFRMTDRRMEQEWGRRPEWIEFWVNLKEGYDFFENVKAPPASAVERGRYVFRIREVPW